MNAPYQEKIILLAHLGLVSIYPSLGKVSFSSIDFMVHTLANEQVSAQECLWPAYHRSAKETKRLGINPE